MSKYDRAICPRCGGSTLIPLVMASSIGIYSGNRNRESVCLGDAC